MVRRGTNGVTNGNLLDRRARQADSAAMTPSSDGRVPVRDHLQRRDRARVLLGVRGVLFRLDVHRQAGGVRPAADAQSRLLVFVGGLTPGILWLTRRFPFDRAAWKMAIPIHVAGVVVATSLHVVLTVALRMGTYWAIGESLDTWLHEAQEMFFLNFDWEMMTYWTIVGVGTRSLSPRSAGTRADRRAARDAARRGAASRRCSGSCSRTSCSTRSTRSRR